MCISFDTLRRKLSLKSSVVFVLLPIFASFGISRSAAQQSSLLSLTAPDQAQVNWSSGPADASLGTLADIKIPKGYRFTDATGAGALLTKMNNPVPEGLVGILAPESGEWWVVLTYKDMGYVKGVDKDKIVPAEILKTVSDRAQRQNESRRLHNLPLITSVDWALTPTYDANTHAVEWAVRVKTQSAQVVNHTVRLLGREGVLDATAVAPYQSRNTSAVIPLNDLMKNISFKQGQRYADYQPGDKISNIGLAGVIIGEDDTATARNEEAASPSKSASGWLLYVLVGVVAGGVFMLFRGVAHRHHKTRRVPATASAVVNSAVGNGSAVSNGNGHVHVAVAAAAPTSALSGTVSAGTPAVTAGLKPKTGVTQNGSNESNHRRNARRKKIFDYHRFYTDTVMKLSSSGYTVEVPPRNGHTNGHANGQSSDLTTDARSASYGTMNQTILQSHLELIANQKALIEEQKRLVQQQTRFIEEKNKLIQEQNALLERQSAMIENQYSLKLESES